MSGCKQFILGGVVHAVGVGSSFVIICGSFNSALDADYEWMDVAGRTDCVELMPQESWPIAGREQVNCYDFSDWIPVGAGRNLCPWGGGGYIFML